jgi:hypothetical protein
MKSIRFSRRQVLGVTLSAGLIGAVAFALPAPTTINDFFGPGTQPNTLFTPIVSVEACSFCHGGYEETHEPFRPWAASMMGQAARDPMFFACLAVAEQDAPGAGDMCIRCHAPGGWLDGRSTPTDGSALIGSDFEGVSCNFCHRMVDPDFTPGVDPAVDQGIIDNLEDQPVNAHSGQYIMDPMDRRRGPFDLTKDFFYHDWLESPFHRDSAMCATCHDVSNPVYERQPDDTYTPGDWNAPAASHDKYDQFPMERTYSEWLMSDFAAGPIDMTGRFGGNNPLVSTCQDCHMADATDRACIFEERPIRDDLPQHHFNGGNTWVLNAVRALYPDSETFLSQSTVDASVNRTVLMLENASDMDLTQNGSDINIRITNESGHKLPTGYPEGRRMWLNVQFFDSADTLIAEHGAYDTNTAVLTTNDTKVYEAKLGITPDVAAAIGTTPGISFHFALNNEVVSDNRIPPRGFDNTNFAAVQAAPVAYTYADGQHWDDTTFTIPAGAARVETRLYYQTTSKEYIEFLRDENTTNTTGQTAYDQWVAQGKSAPVQMDFQNLILATACTADFNNDGVLDFFDVQAFLQAFATQDPSADFTNDGVYDFFDVQAFLQAFSAGCP